MTFPLVCISSSAFKGGLGRALLVRNGGLTFRGGDHRPWALAKAVSFSSELILGLSVDID